MKRIFTAIAFGMLTWVFVTLFCVFIDTLGVCLYGWANDGYGYGIGAIVFGPTVGVAAGAYAWLQMEPK